MALELYDNFELPASPASTVIGWMINDWAAINKPAGMEYDCDRCSYMGSVKRLDYEVPRGLELETEDGHVYRLQLSEVPSDVS